ncbi:hypothetical protein TWF788_003161 [Orbilia oligospora]|uniref:Uncharacterized protein n=1 Tax=Orbilia oligospora TaxID=2813651 RepID=A0A7C8NXG0_ORBOL|nr:hypothetical protein TWF788_003161 [Orbilia oligospora]
MDNPNGPEAQDLASELENLHLERIFRQRGFPPGLISPSFSTNRPAARHQILSTEEYDYSPPQFIPNQTSSPARTPGYTVSSRPDNQRYYCPQHIPSTIGGPVDEIPISRPDWQQYGPDPSLSCTACQMGRRGYQHQQRNNYQRYLQQHHQHHQHHHHQQQQQSSMIHNHNSSFQFRAVNPNPEEQEKRMRRSAEEIRRNIDDYNRHESNIRESNMKVQSWLDRWASSFEDEGEDDENLEEVELV